MNKFHQKTRRSRTNDSNKQAKIDDKKKHLKKFQETNFFIACSGRFFKNVIKNIDKSAKFNGTLLIKIGPDKEFNNISTQLC